MATGMKLSDDAALFYQYQERPSLWVDHCIDVIPARYRPEAELVSWLEGQPPDMHTWCRRQLAAGKLQLGQGSYQADALDAMAHPGNYAFQWANGTAKTTTAALWVHWFLDTHAGAKCLTTAGTWSQLQEQLWREIPYWASKAKVPIMSTGHLFKTKIDIAPDWVTLSRGADRADTFEGLHGEHVAVIVDEAKAVKPEIFDAVRRTLRGNPGGQFWFICMSSPGSPSGPFWDITCGDQAQNWEILKLSAYESERISLDLIREDIDDLGEGSPLFIAMDLGEFPDESEDTVIPLSWIQAAVNRPVFDGELPVIGVDPAGRAAGGDETVFMALYGRRAEMVFASQGVDKIAAAGKLQELWYEIEYTDVGIDDTGLGEGLTDIVRANQTITTRAWPIIFASTDHPKKDKYLNVKALMYYMLRAEFEAGFKAHVLSPAQLADGEVSAVGLSIPNDKKLIHQLACQKREFTDKLVTKIESKEKLKKRGEKSPDRADALAIANYVKRANFANPMDVMAINVQATHEGAGASVRKAVF